MGAGRATLIVARRVHTLGRDEGQPADAVLVRAGRVVAVGRSSELRSLAGDARVLDLGATWLTPGLTDAHIHLVEWALARRAVDLSAAGSAKEAARLVARTAADEGWLRGRGWNANRWPDGPPHRGLLDEVEPSRPIALQSHDMHALWVNSAALAHAGIGRDSPDPPGGRIERDPAGEPTGVLYELACPRIVQSLPAVEERIILDAVRSAIDELNAFGITAVHSFPGVHVPDPPPLGILQALLARDELHLRAVQHIGLDQLREAIELGLRSGFGGDRVRIGGLKLFLDGALGSRTAWMRDAYEGSDDRGIRVTTPEDFRHHVTTAAHHGIAATVHAIGDAAVDLAIDVLTDPALQVPAMPHRIEHAQCVAADALPRLSGVVCSVQPSHLMTDWPAVDRHWGRGRARGAFALASLERHGAVLAFGSDAPVEPADPRRALFAAVARQDDRREPAAGWQPHERLTALAAWRAHTIGPALAAGWADRAGTIRPGTFADFAAWADDPLDVPADRLLELRCVATILAGEVVHS